MDDGLPKIKFASAPISAPRGYTFAQMPVMLCCDYIIDGTEREIFGSSTLKFVKEMEVLKIQAVVSYVDKEKMNYDDLASTFADCAHCWYLGDRPFILMPFALFCLNAKHSPVPFLGRKFVNIEFKTSLKFNSPPKVAKPVRVSVYLTGKEFVF